MIAAVPAFRTSCRRMAALTSVGETYVVGRPDPFQSTFEVGTNPAPFTIRLKSAEPALTDEGTRPVINGTGLTTVTVCEFDVPPPGVGFDTVTKAVPPDVISVSLTMAVSRAGETKVVSLLEPPQKTVDVGTKPAPSTVIMKLPLPAVTMFGVTRKIDGRGLFTVRVLAAEVPPPGAGLNTVTLAKVPAAISALLISAERWVEEMKVVGRPDPFQRTTDPARKPEPVTVSVKP